MLTFRSPIAVGRAARFLYAVLPAMLVLCLSLLGGGETNWPFCETRNLGAWRHILQAKAVFLQKRALSQKGQFVSSCAEWLGEC